MRVEVVHHQYDPISVTVVRIDQSFMTCAQSTFVRRALTSTRRHPSSGANSMNRLPHCARIRSRRPTAPGAGGRGARVSLTCCLLVHPCTPAPHSHRMGAGRTSKWVTSGKSMTNSLPGLEFEHPTTVSELMVATISHSTKVILNYASDVTCRLNSFRPSPSSLF